MTWLNAEGGYVLTVARVRQVAKTKANDAKTPEQPYRTLKPAQASYLPTFCAEVGRAFIAAENWAWAGTHTHVAPTGQTRTSYSPTVNATFTRAGSVPNAWW